MKYSRDMPENLPDFFDMENPIRKKLFGFSYSEKMAKFEAFLMSFSSSAILKFRNVVGQHLIHGSHTACLEG